MNAVDGAFFTTILVFLQLFRTVCVLIRDVTLTYIACRCLVKSRHTAKNPTVLETTAPLYLSLLVRGTGPGEGKQNKQDGD